MAAERLGHYGDRAELRRFRLEEPSWMDGMPQAVRVFLSSLVFHHLDGSGKRDLFVQLFDRLGPGGALLFAVLMEPRTERARRYFATGLGGGDPRRRAGPRVLRARALEHLRSPRPGGQALDAARAVALDGGGGLRGG